MQNEKSEMLPTVVRFQFSRLEVVEIESFNTNFNHIKNDKG